MLRTTELRGNMTLRKEGACAPILPDRVKLSVICFKNGFFGWLAMGQKGLALVPGI